MTLLSPLSPTLCLYITGHSWDHYLLFALTEINQGRYESTLGSTIVPLDYKILFADPTGRFVEGQAQQVFSEHYKQCSAFVGPAWTSQLSAIGEWASLEHKPIVSGGATSPIFAQENYNFVSRVIPSDENLLDAFVQLIVEYELPLINVVYFNDEYGLSIAEGLITRSQGLFDIQLLRSFDNVDDMDAIQSVFNDLEASPTHATFLSMSVLPLTEFLNLAGRRGMHDSHLWLSPTSTQVVADLDPPSTGGIWGLSYGEELQGGEPLALRYMAKDPAPHIEGQELYGLKDDYNVLTYWGAYAYDAVLASAHALAAVAKTNNSTLYDGEELLEAIRALSLNNTNTGTLLTMDENGDRIGARIPLFYLSPEGTAEKFAVYQAGNVTFLEDPLWPGGSRTQPPNLIQLPAPPSSSDDDGYKLVMFIVLPVVAVFLLVAAIWLWKMRKGVRDVRAAPKSGPCCLMFTDIQSSSTLWGVAPTEMSQAIDTHHYIIRGCLVDHGAYEVKTIGDSFMVACGDPDQALQLAIDLQVKLYQAQWDPVIDAAYRDIVDSGDDNNESAHDSSVWRGLRVRASVHYGVPDIVKDDISKGYDYYGTMVNEAARIEGLAHGGQVVVSQAFKDALKCDHKDVQLVELGEHELRGCPEKLALWQVTPTQFQGRTFPPLRTGDITTDVANGDDDDIGEWAICDFDDESTVAGSDNMFSQAEHSKWLKTLFSVLKARQRREMLDKFCAAWRVRDEDQLVNRVARVTSAQERIQGRSSSARSLLSVGDGNLVEGLSRPKHRGTSLRSLAEGLRLSKRKLSLVPENPFLEEESEIKNNEHGGHDLSDEGLLPHSKRKLSLVPENPVLEEESEIQNNEHGGHDLSDEGLLPHSNRKLSLVAENPVLEEASDIQSSENGGPDSSDQSLKLPLIAEKPVLEEASEEIQSKEDGGLDSLDEGQMLHSKGKLSLVTENKPVLEEEASEIQNEEE